METMETPVRVALVAVEKVSTEVLDGLRQPFYLRLRQSLPWWQRHTTHLEVLELIRQGVRPDWLVPPHLPCQPQQKCIADLQKVQEILLEYLDIGAIKEIPRHEARHLIPWFVLEKKDPSGDKKLRLICDCRVLNQYFPTIRLENWAKFFHN